MMHKVIFFVSLLQVDSQNKKGLSGIRPKGLKEVDSADTKENDFLIMSQNDLCNAIEKTTHLLNHNNK